MGRLELTAFFSNGADACTAEMDPGLAGEPGGEGLTAPRGMAGAVRQRIVVHQAIEVGRYRTGHLRWSTGTRAIGKARHPMMGEAMDPCTQRGIRTVERVGDGVETLSCDDFTYGVGTPEHPRLLRLLQEGLSGGEGGLGKVEFAGAHRFALPKKVGRFLVAHSTWLLLSEQSYCDSNFHGAALYRKCF